MTYKSPWYKPKFHTVACGCGEKFDTTSAQSRYCVECKVDRMAYQRYVQNVKHLKRPLIFKTWKTRRDEKATQTRLGA